MENIFVRSISSLPSTVYAMTVVDSESDFNIFINSRVCPAKQKYGYLHEMEHIRLNHFYNGDPVVINELEAH